MFKINIVIANIVFVCKLKELSVHDNEINIRIFEIYIENIE